MGEEKSWGLGLGRTIKLSKKEKDSSQMTSGKKDPEKEKETGCLMERNVHGAGKTDGSDTQRSLLSRLAVWSSSVSDRPLKRLVKAGPHY